MMYFPQVSSGTSGSCRGHLVYQMVVTAHKSYIIAKLMQVHSKKNSKQMEQRKKQMLKVILLVHIPSSLYHGKGATGD